MKALLNLIDRVEGVFGIYTIRYRWPIIIAAILVVLAAGWGLKNAGLASGYRPLFNEGDPKLAAFDALETEFSRVNNLLFIIEPKSRIGSGNVFNREVLTLVYELTDAAWGLPNAIRVDSLTNFQHVTADGDSVFIRSLVEEPDNLNADDLAAIRQVALNDPTLVRELVSEDGNITAVNVNFDLPPYEHGKLPGDVSIHRSADALLAEFEARYPEMNFYLTGRLGMDNAFYEVALEDVEFLIPISVALMLLILLTMSRSLIATLITSLVILASIIFATGIIAYLEVPFHTGNAPGPTIILTIASAGSVHLIMTYLHQMKMEGRCHQAIVEALRVNLQPITLTSITTAIGFLSILFSDIPAFRVLATMVTLGIVAALLLTVFVLPALLSFLPDRPPAFNHVPEDRAGDAMSALGRWVVRHSRTVMLTMIAFVLLMVANIPRNNLNDAFIGYFDPAVEFRQHTDFAMDNLSGVYMLQFPLRASEEGAVNDPAFLKEADAFVTWLHQQPEVQHVRSPTEIYKRLNRSMHGDKDEYYRLPDSREEAAQYLLLYELSLPYGLEVSNLINLDKSAIRVLSKLGDLDSREFIAFNERAIAWVKDHAPHIQLDSGISPSLMFGEKSLSNGRNMLITTSLALIAISGLLILMLRSWRMGLISLIPNLVPAAIGFGIWGMIDGEITITLSLVMTMTLGIVVDDTVHFLSKYQRARTELGLCATEAVVYSFKTVGQALVITSLMLAGGFFVLMQSNFLLNSEMGMLTGIIILAALVADFLLLPPLLILFDKSGALLARPTGAPSTTPINPPRD